MSALDHSPDQYNLVEFAAGYLQFELEQAISDAVGAIRAQRAAGRPNMTEKQELREFFSDMVRPYGFYVASIPVRKGVGYDGN